MSQHSTPVVRSSLLRGAIVLDWRDDTSSSR